MEESGKSKLPFLPNSMMKIPVSSETDFFRWWCIFLRPFVHLTDKEIEVITSFLKIRKRLSAVIFDQGVLDKMTMSEDSRKEVMSDCRISKQNFYVLMSNLRKHGIIKGETIDPRLIPTLRADDNGRFHLLIVFENNGQGDNKKGSQ